MVKITLEYGSVEEAIQALGKLSGLAKVRRAASTGGAATGSEVAQPAVASEAVGTGAAGSALAAPPTRGRGRPRKEPKAANPSVEAGASAGSRAGDGGTAAVEKSAEPVVVAQAAEPTSTPSTAAPAASSEPVPSEAAQPVPTEADVQAATEALFAATNKSIGIVTGIMAEFGVRKLRELKPEQRAAYIKRAIEETPK